MLAVDHGNVTKLFLFSDKKFKEFIFYGYGKVPYIDETIGDMESVEFTNDGSM